MTSNSHKRQPARCTLLLAGLLLAAGAAAQIDRGGEGRGFDLRLQQSRGDRQWRSADPLTRQRRETVDLRQRLRIEDQAASQRRDPVPDPLVQDRQRRALDFDIERERGLEGPPPAIQRPSFEIDHELRRDLDRR